MTTPTACTTFRRPVLWLVVLRPSAVSSSAGVGNVGGDIELGQQHVRHPDTFNTVWSATEFGLYELCFTENECGIESCYEVEVGDVPAIELSEDDEVWVCGDDILDLTAFVTDPAGAASINWPYPGNDDVTQNDYTWTQYSTPTLVVTVTNGCGEAADSKWQSRRA